MFVKIFFTDAVYTRPSKFGNNHQYSRSKTWALFICDCCQTEFTREKSKMDGKRLSNEYYHVCSKCDSKKFAQSKGVERRKIWTMSADTDIDISKF